MCKDKNIQKYICFNNNEQIQNKSSYQLRDDIHPENYYIQYADYSNFNGHSALLRKPLIVFLAGRLRDSH